MTSDSYRRTIYENYATNFQDAAASFDAAAATKWGRPYRHYLRSWLPLAKDARILDVACGGGRLLHFYKSLGYENISGVDLSPEQVALSRQVTPNVFHENALEFLARHPGAFDLISGLDIVEHFHKPEVMLFLQSCWSALKPEGRLLLQTPNAESPWGSVHRYNDFTHEVGFNPNALGRLLSLVGFKSIESREMGPIALGHSAKSTVRFLVWQGIRLGLQLWNLAEIGAPGSGVFTRVFLISGVKA
jgi:SAM-dependent methyltransferase